MGSFCHFVIFQAFSMRRNSFSRRTFMCSRGPTDNDACIQSRSDLQIPQIVWPDQTRPSCPISEGPTMLCTDTVSICRRGTFKSSGAPRMGFEIWRKMKRRWAIIGLARSRHVSKSWSLSRNDRCR